MSNGYLLAADADLPDLGDVAAGFGLDALSAASFGSHQDTAAALQGAANVGIVLSHAATRDVSFVALLHVLANTLRTAQLILAEPDAREAFGFLPGNWQTMLLADARARAADLTRRRAETDADGVTRAHPLPPVDEAPPAPPVDETPPSPPVEVAPVPPIEEHLDQEEELSPETSEPAPDLADEDVVVGSNDAGETARPDDSFGAGGELQPSTNESAAEEQPAEQPGAPKPVPPPATVSPAPQPQAPPQPKEQPRLRREATPSAPADATAFAPKKLRRESPELVRIVIHQPKDLKDVIKTARQIDPRTDAAPSGMKVGDVPLGSSVAVALEVRGAACDGALQRRTWQGEPLDFNFTAEADADVKQVVFLARVFIDDAQIGVLAFTRPVGGPKKEAASTGGKVRLKRHKRVFLSYSSKDRETVSAIATAYEAAGVQHFFDRTSLKSGEEWSPRLRREIEQADLFHLCWSKSAAESEWVEKEAEHALTRRRRSNGKKPEITVQMLDGPPWAKHPPHLDSINFDDFVRAAIVGYARGDGSN
ncbi:MAG: toll/interleukin-1 receptor domain-containing protein [Caulobacteraceae bacterium]|nr:toll/interleukin-1 receptor domain-containing protein [Caulobacteraceae bacterium]